jgi:hypothetical protein
LCLRIVKSVSFRCFAVGIFSDIMYCYRRFEQIDGLTCQMTSAVWSSYSVEIPETDRIRRFAYEKWVYFFEKFYVDGEEEIMTRRSGFICFCPVDNFLQFFKVQSKLDPSIAP